MPNGYLNIYNRQGIAVKVAVQVGDDISPALRNIFHLSPILWDDGPPNFIVFQEEAQAQAALTWNEAIKGK